MPPRWPRKPDRVNDPDYRRLDDRMNFAIHVGLLSAVNSGLWFYRNLKPDVLPWLKTFTLVWIGILVLHGIYIFAIADYSPASVPQKTQDSG
ncbi:2TM domain-containing protein [Romeria aff. gracilis LEGE 07310]|uniref:2TM domain-containing protein n=1 Tax=Vasconcelosia minhoensis LEGE 07310 TaxID=915328 RepID=A0A8J7DBW7_9CYAN|nr:2TM domain-containing protein [Romeria gracilis]MBE9077033.1 2TM domain-containing protein [Romeria aff. gracilis LEGE 07310]